MAWSIENGEQFEQLINKFVSKCWKNIIDESDWINKEKSNEFVGIFLHGGEKPVNYQQIYLPFASFIKNSKYKYPILWFYGGEINDEVNKILNKFDNVQLVPIKSITNSQDLNDFYLYQLPKLIPEEFENILYFQDDGFLIKSGWEQFVLDNDIDYAGAPWYDYINYPLLIHEFYIREENLKRAKFPFCQYGNGGFSFRKRSKLMRLIACLPNPDKLHYYEKKLRQIESYKFTMGVTEDWLTSHIGINRQIFKELDIATARDFAQELTIEWIGKKIKSPDDIKSFGFHCNYVNKVK